VSHLNLAPAILNRSTTAPYPPNHRQVHFIKWTPQDGSQVLCLEPHELASELSMLSTTEPPTPASASDPSTPLTSRDGAAAATAASIATASGSAPDPATATAGGGAASLAAAAAARFTNPMTGVQAVLDHHHGSYAQELEAAAIRELARLLKEARGQGQGQQQQPQQDEDDQAPLAGQAAELVSRQREAKQQVAAGTESAKSGKDPMSSSR
jgi:hypothetical protein